MKRKRSGVSGVKRDKRKPRRDSNHYDRMPIGCALHFLDSGSFTIWKNFADPYSAARPEGGPYGYYNTKEFRRYLDDYAAFVLKYKAAVDYCSNVDVIPNPELTWRNQRYLERKGLKPVPVVHYTTPVEWVKFYIDKGYDYISFGGMVGSTSKPECRKWLDEAFSVVCDTKDKTPRVKIHGFGVTNYRFLWRYPWYSLDSARWTKAGAYGKILVPHKRNGRFSFVEQPYEIVISDEAQQENVPGWKFSKLGPNEKKIVLDWLEEINMPLGRCDAHGVPLEHGVSTSHLERKAANLLFYERLRKAIPEYPWPFRAGSVKGFGIRT